MTVLTQDMIERRTKGISFDKIESLNVWGCEIHDMNIIRTLPNLTVLVLSMNNIDNLEPLHNLIKLETLYLRQNKIAYVWQLSYLQTLPKLAYLWLSENPFCERLGANYRREVLGLMPNLITLDTIKVTPEEVQDALLAKTETDLRNEGNLSESETETDTNNTASTFRAQAQVFVPNTTQNSTQHSPSSSARMYFPLLRSVFTNRAEALGNTMNSEHLRHVHSYMDLRHLPADYGYEGYVRTPSRYYTSYHDRDRARRTDILEATMHLLGLLDSRNLHLYDEHIRRILDETRMLHV